MVRRPFISSFWYNSSQIINEKSHTSRQSRVKLLKSAIRTIAYLKSDTQFNLLTRRRKQNNYIFASFQHLYSVSLTLFSHTHTHSFPHSLCIIQSIYLQTTFPRIFGFQNTSNNLIVVIRKWNISRDASPSTIWAGGSKTRRPNICWWANGRSYFTTWARIKWEPSLIAHIDYSTTTNKMNKLQF